MITYLKSENSDKTEGKGGQQETLCKLPVQRKFADVFCKLGLAGA